MARKVAIAAATIRNDVHALFVQRAMRKRFSGRFHILESNALSGNSGLTWTVGRGSVLPTRDGANVRVADLDVVWWRRTSASQLTPKRVKDPNHVDLIENDCQAAFQGSLLTHFEGVWVSHPEKTRAAENKLVQLCAAQSCGLRVPDTLITQDPDDVRSFFERHRGNVIVKPVRGSHRVGILTQRLTYQHLRQRFAIRLSPATYQELIPGTRHLRVHCFGNRCLAALLETPDLDWRGNLNVPMKPYVVSTGLQKKLIRTLDVLGLRMGVFDLKLTDDDEPVWLEVNPQGQFLFVQGITGLDLVTPLCEFLLEPTR